MQRNTLIVTVVSVVFGSLQVAVSMGQPSDPVCDSSGGGPEICVRFDNLGNSPNEGVDFTFDFSDSNNPGVDLLRGTDAQTTRVWRIWCKDGSNPADIGYIRGTATYNYDVKILDPSDNAGADDVGGINLNPNGAAYYSRLLGGTIAGNLTGDLFLQESSGAQGGTVDFTIEGYVTADITIPHGAGLTIEGDFGAMSTYEYLNIGDIVNGNLTIEGEVRQAFVNVTDKIQNGNLQIGENVAYMTHMTIEEMASSSQLRIGYLYPTKMVSSTIITINSGLPVGSTIDMEYETFGQSSTLTFGTDHISGTVLVGTCYGSIIADDLSGTIDIKTSFTGLIDLGGNMSGSVLVNSDEESGNFLGDVDIAGNMTGSASILVSDNGEGEHGEFGSSASISVHGNSGIGAQTHITIEGDADGEILADDDISGTINIASPAEFNGNICGANLTPGDASPENLNINWGRYGRVCDMYPFNGACCWPSGYCQDDVSHDDCTGVDFTHEGNNTECDDPEIICPDLLAPEMNTAHSVASHNETEIGLNVELDEPGNPDGGRFVEPRLSGGGKIVVTFCEEMNESIAENTENIEVIDHNENEVDPEDMAAELTGNGTVLTITFPGLSGDKLADQTKYTFNLGALQDLAGHLLSGGTDANFIVRILIGSVDGDYVVDPFDSNAVMANFGNPVNESTARYDVDCNEVIDPFDRNAVVSRYNNTVPE